MDATEIAVEALRNWSRTLRMRCPRKVRQDAKRRLREAMRMLEAEHAVTPRIDLEREVLRLLRSGPCTVRDLGDRSEGRDASYMRDVVKRLEKRGLVRRSGTVWVTYTANGQHRRQLASVWALAKENGAQGDAVHRRTG